MESKRPYQYEKTNIDEHIDPTTTYVPVDSGNWKRPRILTIKNFSGLLEIKFNNELLQRNVTAVDYVNQGENPELPPDTFQVNTRTHIAVDDNYIYVWIPSQSRWKRTILCEWAK